MGGGGGGAQRFYSSIKRSMVGSFKREEILAVLGTAQAVSYSAVSCF